MNHSGKLSLPVCLFGIYVIWITGSASAYLSNLSQKCFRCLCYVVTQCDHNGCEGGYCGPFNITREYWNDAGRMIMPQDDVERHNAWQDCALDYKCSTRIIEGYLKKYGKDCNSDGVTDCFDYMLVNANGGEDCSSPLNRSVNGRRWLQRYEACRGS